MRSELESQISQVSDRIGTVFNRIEAINSLEFITPEQRDELAFLVSEHSWLMSNLTRLRGHLEEADNV